MVLVPAWLQFKVCDSALLLAEGRCIADGKASEVIQQYLRDVDRVRALSPVERTDREGSGEVGLVSMSLEEDSSGDELRHSNAERNATLHLVIENHTTAI